MALKWPDCTVEGQMQLPQGLAQVFLGLLSRTLPPQQTGQSLAWVGTVSVQEKIAEQFLDFAPVEAFQRPMVALHAELPEEVDT